MLARRRPPEGVAGIAQLHELIGRFLPASRYRERHGVSGAKSDSADAHMLADHGPHRLSSAAPGGRGQPGGGGGQGDRPDAQDAARAAKLTRAQVSAARKRARRRNIKDKTDAILAGLRAEHLGQPPALTAAYAGTVRSLIALITTLNEQVKTLEGQVGERLGRHPDAETHLSQPGLGEILGARILGESGDDPHRYAGGKARRNYPATSPITRASGK